VQDEIEFTLMWGFLSTSDEPAAHHCDEAGIHSDVLLVRENDSGIGAGNSAQIGGVLIDKQSHSGRDTH
jgi:hypothetical protein